MVLFQNSLCLFRDPAHPGPEEIKPGTNSRLPALMMIDGADNGSFLIGEQRQMMRPGDMGVVVFCR